MAAITERPRPTVTAGNIVPVKVLAYVGSLDNDVFSMVMDFSSHPVASNQFKFRWNNQPKEYWITISNTPPLGSATAFRTKEVSESLGDYLIAFTTFLNSVFELSDEFVFEKHSTLNHIIITARRSGQLYNLELLSPFPSGLSISRSPVTDITSYNYYRLVAELYQVNGSNLLSNFVGRDALPFQEGGQLFDLSEYLLAEFKGFDQPLNSEYQLRPDLFKEFSVRGTESVGIPPSYMAFTNPIAFMALPGKLPDWYKRERDISIRNFFDPPSTSVVPFLSNCTERKTAPGLSHRLFFQADAGLITTVAFHIEAWLDTGINPVSELVFQTDEFSRKKLFEINLDWNYLEQNMNPINFNGVIPDYFLCYLSEPEDPTAYISEIAIIEVDQEQRFSKLAFRYRNMFGVYDDLLCIGQISEGTEYNKEESIRTTRTGNDARMKARLYTHSSESVVKTKASTGMTEDLRMLDVFRDFVESQEIYLQENGNMIPVKIFTNSTKDIDQGSRLYSLEFEFAITGVENAYYYA